MRIVETGYVDAVTGNRAFMIEANKKDDSGWYREYYMVMADNKEGAFEEYSKGGPEFEPLGSHFQGQDRNGDNTMKKRFESYPKPYNIHA